MMQPDNYPRPYPRPVRIDPRSLDGNARHFNVPTSRPPNNISRPASDPFVPSPLRRYPPQHLDGSPDCCCRITDVHVQGLAGSPEMRPATHDSGYFADREDNDGAVDSETMNLSRHITLTTIPGWLEFKEDSASLYRVEANIEEPPKSSKSSRANARLRRPARKASLSKQFRSILMAFPDAIAAAREQRRIAKQAKAASNLATVVVEATPAEVAPVVVAVPAEAADEEGVQQNSDMYNDLDAGPSQSHEEENPGSLGWSPELIELLRLRLQALADARRRQEVVDEDAEDAHIGDGSLNLATVQMGEGPVVEAEIYELEA